MLRIYSVILDWVADLPPRLREISAHDPNLADQLRRSSTAVALNVAEGYGATGKVKTNCYRIALREMREAVAVLELAQRLQYLARLNPSTAEDEARHDANADRQSRIIGTLVRLARLQTASPAPSRR